MSRKAKAAAERRADRFYRLSGWMLVVLWTGFTAALCAYTLYVSIGAVWSVYGHPSKPSTCALRTGVL